jgi:hypothetical protein
LLAELRKAGHDITLVTPGDVASAWTGNTIEACISKQLRRLGITVVTHHDVTRLTADHVRGHLRLWATTQDHSGIGGVGDVSVAERSAVSGADGQGGESEGRHQVNRAHW